MAAKEKDRDKKTACKDREKEAENITQSLANMDMSRLDEIFARVDEEEKRKGESNQKN